MERFKVKTKEPFEYYTNMLQLKKVVIPIGTVATAFVGRDKYTGWVNKVTFGAPYDMVYQLGTNHFNRACERIGDDG